eukprot:gene26810-4405_t
MPQALTPSPAPAPAPGPSPPPSTSLSSLCVDMISWVTGAGVGYDGSLQGFTGRSPQPSSSDGSSGNSSSNSLCTGSSTKSSETNVFPSSEEPSYLLLTRWTRILRKYRML